MISRLRKIRYWNYQALYYLVAPELDILAMNRLTLFFSLLIGLCQVSVAQSTRGADSPPDFLIRHFETSYQNASQLRWTARNEGGFIASFVWENMPSEAHYDGRGNWLFTDNFLPVTQLPQATQDHLRRMAPGVPSPVYGNRDIAPSRYFFMRYQSGGVKKEWRYDREGKFLGEFRL